MTNPSYLRGRLAEWKCQKELEALGYTTIRAAGSKGKTDILAWNAGVYRHIQLKTFITRKPPSYESDIQALLSIVMPSNGIRELWVRKKGTSAWYGRWHIIPTHADPRGYILWSLDAPPASNTDTPNGERAG